MKTMKEFNEKESLMIGEIKNIFLYPITEVKNEDDEFINDLSRETNANRLECMRFEKSGNGDILFNFDGEVYDILNLSGDIAVIFGSKLYDKAESDLSNIMDKYDKEYEYATPSQMVIFNK